jgi:predicted metal-binding protein
MDAPKYIVILQCHIVKERCSGYFCEESFTKRLGAFSIYPKDAPIRYISFTCGGCCGRATLRKLSNFLKNLKKKDSLSADDVVLHFSSCICRENFHGPGCPHYSYLKQLVERKNIKWLEGTRISETARSRRDSAGKWSRKNQK